MAYAVATDVAELMARDLSVEETAMVNRRLGQVERMIVRRVPDLVAQVTAGDIAQADVVDIEAEAVYRVLRNPEGMISEGDGTYTYQLSKDVADNRLRITSDEWAVLGVRVGSMFSITPNVVLPT